MKRVKLQSVLDAIQKTSVKKINRLEAIVTYHGLVQAGIIDEKKVIKPKLREKYGMV